MRGRHWALLLAGLGAALVVGAASGGSNPPTPKGLLLWNTLGSAQEVTHSAFGPNLALFNCHAKRAPHFGPRCSIDIRGKLAFVDGPFSKAATIGGGPYFPEARVHTALLRQSILNPEHGAIEAWYWQKKDPEPFKDNPHRIFAGGYNLGGAGDVNLQVQDRVDSGDPRLLFSIFFGRNKARPTIIWARSTVDHHIGYYDEGDILRLVGAFEAALHDHGATVEPGAAVGAAQQSFRSSPATSPARVG